VGLESSSGEDRLSVASERRAANADHDANITAIADAITPSKS
jgi:hypothetical protein